MSEWKKVKLGDLFERVTRKNTNLESDNVLTISAQYGLINQEEFFNKSVAGKNLKNYYLLKKGEFAYNKSYSDGHPMGATKMLEKYDYGVVSTLYICFRSKSELVNNEYFKYYFESKQYYDELSKIVQEGARNHGLLNVSTEDFFNIHVTLPPIKEQVKICTILSNIDNIIKNIENDIYEIKRIKKALFTRICENNKNTGSKRYLKDICNYRTSNISIKMLKENGKYDLYDANKIIGKIDKCIDEKYITIIKDGAGVGRVRILKKNSNCIGTMGIITSDKINLAYLYYYLNYINLEKYVVGTTIPHIYFKDYGNLVIYIPNEEIQIRQARVMSQIDKKIKLKNNLKNKYTDLKRILMKKLLTGKVKVNV